MQNEELNIICDDIVTYLSLTQDKAQVFHFLRDLLSEKEMLEFSRRFQVAKLLSNKVSYAQIEQQTGMSSTTIARISKFLSGDNKGYKNALSLLQSVSSRHHEGHQS